mmetsp:Transcript_15566/g.32982  ORF Transcript_15566/g.32982 Transcript_15566/m.32982 type:complete len:466 (+) Transcript_15566:2339-3736(+)
MLRGRQGPIARLAALVIGRLGACPLAKPLALGRAPVRPGAKAAILRYAAGRARWVVRALVHVDGLASALLLSRGHGERVVHRLHLREHRDPLPERHTVAAGRGAGWSDSPIAPDAVVELRTALSGALPGLLHGVSQAFLPAIFRSLHDNAVPELLPTTLRASSPLRPVPILAVDLVSARDRAARHRHLRGALTSCGRSAALINKITTLRATREASDKLGLARPHGLATAACHWALVPLPPLAEGASALGRLVALRSIWLALAGLRLLQVLALHNGAALGAIAYRMHLDLAQSRSGAHALVAATAPAGPVAEFAVYVPGAVNVAIAPLGFPGGSCGGLAAGRGLDCDPAYVPAVAAPASLCALGPFSPGRPLAVRAVLHRTGAFATSGDLQHVLGLALLPSQRGMFFDEPVAPLLPAMATGRAIAPVRPLPPSTVLHGARRLSSCFDARARGSRAGTHLGERQVAA